MIVLFSAILASRVLKERLNLLGKVGCFLCVIGSTVMVIHSPKEQEVANIDQLKAMVAEPGEGDHCTVEPPFHNLQKSEKIRSQKGGGLKMGVNLQKL